MLLWFRSQYYKEIALLYRSLSVMPVQVTSASQKSCSYPGSSASAELILKEFHRYEITQFTGCTHQQNRHRCAMISLGKTLLIWYISISIRAPCKMQIACCDCEGTRGLFSPKIVLVMYFTYELGTADAAITLGSEQPKSAMCKAQHC